MAKKQHKQPATTGSQPAKPAAVVPKAQPTKTTAPAMDGNSFITKYADVLIIAGISILTFLFYKVCFNNELTNWDDLGYIITDPLIKDSSAEGIRKIFNFTDPMSATVMGNYHPLTIVLYAIEYSYYGLEPWIYHVDSVLAHILVTIAVYGFVKVLTRRTAAAAIAALLFGLHPMHVESVAWAAGRKDLIYSFFYLLSCTAYLYYLRNAGTKKIVWYILVILLFALSLMAKSVGVTLPVILLLLDYFEKRRISVMLLVDKIPMFGLSLLFGLLSVQAQKKIGALGTLDVNFTHFERIGLAGYALCTYLWKCLIPVGMVNFYPYPMKVNDALPATFYLYPLLIIGALAAIWRFARHNRVVIFGIGFLIINLLLLLQLLPVGGAIMSDRYTYLPYLGLFLIAGWFFSNYFESREKQQTGKIIAGVVIAYSLVLGYLTTERCKDWHDSVTLWKNNLEQHPENPVAWFYLGQEYYSRFEAAKTPAERQLYQDSSLIAFTASIQRKPDYLLPIVCLGELQRSTGQIDAAKQTYLKALKISDKNESAYLGLGVVYSIRQQFDSAGYAFQTALKIKPFFPEGHSNYANYFDILGKVDSSLKEYAIAIAQNPDAVIPYMNRARILIRTNKLEDAIKDYTKVIALKPDNGEAYYDRSVCYSKLGKTAQEAQDVQHAKELGYKAPAPAASPPPKTN